MSTCLFKPFAASLLFLTAFAGFADVDENGRTPSYWFKFDDQNYKTQSGSKTANINTWQVPTPDYVKTDSGYAVKNYENWSSSPLDIASSSSWTAVFRARTDGTAGSTFSCYGSAKTAEHQALILVQDSGKVVLKMGNNVQSPKLVNLISVPLAADRHFHSYAIAVDAGLNTVSLYVDGVKGGEAAFTVGSNTFDIQFAGPSGAGGLTPSGKTQELDDWRMYEECLTASEIAKIAQAQKVWPTDEIGNMAAYWMKFNDSFDQYGTQSASLTASGTPSYEDGYNGRRAAYGFTHWTSSDLQSTGVNGSWTVSVVAKFGAEFGKSSQWATHGPTLFSLGNPKNSTQEAPALVLWLGNNGVKLQSGYRAEGAVGNTYVDLMTATVKDPAAAYHLYTLVFNGETSQLSYYVDGEPVESKSVPGLSRISWPFGFSQVLGSSGSVMDSCADNRWQDWRFYCRALKADEVYLLARKWKFIQLGLLLMVK